ncbi:3-phosphoglycerate dehydrogenase [Myroides marinus]|uniref:3-phosphoglycerate dehydrogenase n=1 Tax=Myroides marinus TaxID=703342 RepID=A0A165R551_9FLAO|nr:D-2-hydroxyacid dehydrogenase family protein [Myroides marinus]KZE78872.1 3-phosphoglycerate dehydrogenase [Myroides marinus]
MKITILDDYQNVIENLQCYKLLEGQQIEIIHHFEKDVDKLAELLKDTEIVVLTRERTEISEALLSKLPKLKLISQTGKISNHLNLSICTEHKVAVAEGTGSPVAPSELTWTLILNTIRKVPQAIQAMKEGKWQTNIGRSVHGKTIGIWGYGKIGQQLAQYAKVFGANVLVWGSENSRAKAVEDGFFSANSKEEFFQSADIVTVNLRLNKDTYGIVKESDLRHMKPNAVLVNTARAELIEKGALINVLRSGQQLLVGVDVYEEEPIYDVNHELLKYDNVVCTPHIGYVEESSYELYFEKAFENVINYINGDPSNIANPEVL